MTVPLDRLVMEARAKLLVNRLGGRWASSGGLCLCPAHDDHHPSLSVRLGKTALLFKCFAGCHARDVLRAIARIDHQALTACHEPGHSTRDFQSGFRTQARDIWHASRPIADTPAQAYLQSRSITNLGEWLRFHPRTPLLTDTGLEFRPAMIAGVRDRGEIVAIHRTFLDPRYSRLAADVQPARRLLGRPGHGAVMLAPATDILGLAEGIETALSAMSFLDIPVWATLGSERLHSIAIPASVKRLIILPDNDRAGKIAAMRALAAYRGAGRPVRHIWPPSGYNDWNDVQQAREGGGLDDVAQEDPMGGSLAPGDPSR